MVMQQNEDEDDGVDGGCGGRGTAVWGEPADRDSSSTQHAAACSSADDKCEQLVQALMIPDEC